MKLRHYLLVAILILLIMQPISAGHEATVNANSLAINSGKSLGNTNDSTENHGTPIRFRLMSNGYGYIDVSGPSKVTTETLPSDWFNLTWKYRAKVSVTETYGIARPNQLITVHLTFPESQCRVGTIIVVDNSTNPARIIPSQVWGATYYSQEYYESVYVSWVTTLAANEHKLFYIYWNDEPTGYSYPFTTDKNRFLVYSDYQNGYHIENKYFKIDFYINGGIDISVNGQKLARNSLFYQTSTTYPSNATYIWLDSTTMANYTGYNGQRDHIKIIAWYDSTRIKIYGYNGTIDDWELLVDTTLNSNDMFRYPPSGEPAYNLTRVESDKPVSIFVGDLGAIQTNQYGVDSDSDDAFYSYFGTYVVLWVPRDLFIAAYFNDTHVKVIDTSEGDDSFELTLNEGEVWFHGMGDERTYYGYYTYSYYDTSESEGPSFFENDIVRIIADKPVTILGGYFSNDFFGMVKGYEYKEYVFPFFSRFTITPLYNDTNVNVTLKFYNATSEEFEVYKTFSLNLDANDSYEVTDDPDYVKIVVAVDLYKNSSASPVPFNITILVFNETARRHRQTPYWIKYLTYTGTVTPTAKPSDFHYDEPESGNWNETVVTLEGGRSYWIILGWNGTDDLDLYVYWYNKSPLMDGTGDDFELQVRPNWNLGYDSRYGDFTANEHEAYWYLAAPIRTGVNYDGSTYRPYSVELKHEEWGIAIVKADKPILVYTGTGYWGYEGTDGATGYGGQYLYCGKVFDLAFPFQNRYVKIAALEPDTTIRVWINGSDANWRSRDLSTDVRVIRPNVIQLDHVGSWVNIPLPMKSRIHIEADKPVVLKVLQGWSGTWDWDHYSIGEGIYTSWPEPDHYNPVYYSTSAGVYYSYARVGYEELSLLVLDPSAPIVSLDKVVEGPIFTKVEVSWGIVGNLIVEDTYIFVANASGFILNRIIKMPEYVSMERQITFLGFELTDLWNTKPAYHNVSLYPFDTVSAGSILNDTMILFPDKDYILGVYETETSLSFAAGILSLDILGYSQLQHNATVSGYIYEMERSRIYHTGYVMLEGGESNSINASYMINIGTFGANIFDETKNYIMAYSKSLEITIGDYESTAIDVTVKVRDLDDDPIMGAKITLHSTTKNVNITKETDSTGTATFFDIPASDDYQLKLIWTNDSPIFSSFPVAYRENTSLSITGDTIFEYTVSVKDFYLKVYDGDRNLFRAQYIINITGKYIYGTPPQEEIIIKAENIQLDSAVVKFNDMPVGKEPTGTVDYNITGRYTSAYGISVSNFTTFAWSKTNTTNIVSFMLKVSDLYVRVIDVEGTVLPGAIAYLYCNSKEFSSMTNGSGITEFPYLPHGTYELNAEYYGVMASSNVTVEFNTTDVFNVTVPVKYGEKPAYITVSQDIYEAYWGKTVTVYAQFVDSLTGEAVQANMTIWVIDRFTDEIIISGTMTNVTETTYAFEISLTTPLKAGQSYIIQVNGFNPDYTKPSPANATLYVLPIPLVVDYPDKVENYWGRQVRIHVNVTHTEEFLYTPVSGAIVKARILKEGVQYRSLTLNEDVDVPGYYWADLTLDGNLSVGVYTVEISIKKLGYSNTTVKYTLSVLLVPTILIANASSIDVYYSKSVYVEISYVRTDTSEGITNATVHWVLLDENNNTVVEDYASEQVNGKYLVIISTTSLMLKTYLLVITGQKSNFASDTASVSILVKPIPTAVYVNATSVSIEWGLTTTFNITFYDTVYSTRINADSTHVRICNSIGYTVYTSTPTPQTTGIYMLELNTTELNLVPDVYTITVQLNKTYYVNQTLNLVLQVKIVETFAYVQPANVTLYWGDSTTALAYYIRTRDNAFIAVTPDLNITDLTVGVQIYQGVTITIREGYYEVFIDTSKLINGHTYAVTITFRKTHYKEASATIYVYVLPIPTVATASKTSEELEWGLSTTIEIWYNDSRTLTPVSSPDNVTYAIWNGSELVNTYDLTAGPVGNWTLNIDTVNMHLAPGVYTVYVYLEKAHYENKTIVITLTVKEISTYAYVQPANMTLYWGDNATATAYYIRSRDNVFIIVSPEFNITDITNGTRVYAGVTTIIQADRYGIFVDTTKLVDGHTYAITIVFRKTYYEEQTVILYVRVLPISVTVSVVPLTADITWGDDFNFTVTVLNALNLSGVEHISIRMIVYVSGEEVSVGQGIQVIELGDGVYVVMVKSGLLNTTSYNVYLALNKPHYALPSVNVTARINPVRVTVTVRTEKTVQKNPATGAATTRVEIVLRETETGAPITNAVVKVYLMRGETIAKELTAEELEDNSGVYVAYIDWSNIEPGDYTIRVKVEKIQRRGYTASAETTMDITEGVTEIGVRVDYLGGSTVIAGKRYPNLIIYPVLITVLLLAGFMTYRYYSWIKLPIEVREVITLMKKIQKDIYEYTAPTREDAFKEIIAHDLGLE